MNTKHSESTRKLWQNSNYRIKTIAAIKESMEYPEYRIKRSKITKALWRKSDFRTKRAETIEIRNNNICQKINGSLNRDWLYQQYIIENKTTYTIGREIGVSHETVRLWLKKYNIPIKPQSKRLVFTEDMREKIRIARKQNNPGGFQKGHKRTLGRIQPLEERKMRSFINSMEKNPNWKGGLSFEPYGSNWTSELKKVVLIRDMYKCQICQDSVNLQIHHIDYDKTHNNVKNLITLCAKCHGKTNSKRNYWREMLCRKIETSVHAV
jgi:hypothetical protein